VAGTQDGSWSHHCFAWLYMVVNPSHMGADVDGVAYFLHRPMVYNCQMRGQRFLTGATPSRHTVVGGGIFPEGCEAPGDRYLMRC
jgi:hypothetical protein